MTARAASAGTAQSRAARTKPAPPHRLVVDVAAWLSESDLLLAGRLPAPVAAAIARRDPGPGEPRLMVLPPEGADSDARFTRVLVHWPAQQGEPAGESTPGSPSVKLVAAEVTERTGTVQELAREALAWRDAGTRAAALEFLIRATTAPGATPRRAARSGPLFTIDREARLATALHALREALRERLPVSLTHDGPMALVDAVARIDRDAFFMRGRVRAGASAPVRVTAVSPEGSRVEILERAYWHDLGRPGEQPGGGGWKGFAVFFTCAPSVRADGWLIELEAKSGELLEVGAPRVATHTADVIRSILEELSVERLPATRLRNTQVVPAVRRLQRARQRAARVATVKRFGAPVASPTVSVIVPLYRRIDLVEHQLTQFADDPGFQSVDLLFVLDSPELEDELLESARRLFALYGQPFRVAVLSANVGFAAANNLGASIAEGRILLLLNSDVFPEAKGWLDAMVRFYEGLPNAGAVGPKLLYEDDTLQHAGMFFERLSDSQPWNNEHYFKGMHRDLPAAAESRPVPAVTGACMMIARDLYLKMGGLSGDYLQGDFEDSDLCLRLLEAGRQNWYFADVALYHLEASSYDPERRRLHDGFNRWLHTHVWAERLAALGGPGPARIAATTAAATAAKAAVAALPDDAEGEVAAGAPAGS